MKKRENLISFKGRFGQGIEQGIHLHKLLTITIQKI